MSNNLSGSIAIALYLAIVFYQLRQMLSGKKLNTGLTKALGGFALFFHGFLSYNLILSDKGVDLGFFNVAIGVFFIINLILLLSSIRKTLTPLFLPWFSMTAIGLALSLLLDRPSPPEHIPLDIGIHIVASILAYSLLTIASLQGLVLAMQNWLLRHKHLNGWLTTLPPLQVMESLLFEFLWSGFILLTLSLITGALFFENIHAQHLSHKIFFSCLGWVFYAILLWGHHIRGWRGNTAVRWTLGGFIALVLAYWGTKLVLEILLSQG